MKNILYAILASFILSQDVLGMSMVRSALARSSSSLSDNSIQPLDNPTNEIDNIIENIENMLHDIEKIKQYPDNTILIDENLKKSGLSINTETIRDFNDNRFLGINDFKLIQITLPSVTDNGKEIENYEDLVDAILELNSDKLDRATLLNLKGDTLDRATKRTLLNIINKLKIALITEIDKDNSVEDILKKSLLDQFTTSKSKYSNAEQFYNLFPMNIGKFLQKQDIFKGEAPQTPPRIESRKRIIENMRRGMKNTKDDIDLIINNNSYYKSRFYQLKHFKFENKEIDIDKRARFSFFVWQNDGYCYNSIKEDKEFRIGFILKKDPMYQIKDINAKDPEGYNKRLQSANKSLKDNLIASLIKKMKAQLTECQNKNISTTQRINRLGNQLKEISPAITTSVRV